MIDIKYIPEDLADYYDYDDISYQDNLVFDDAMIKAGFFEYGGTRRSHRHITSKFHKTDYFDVISTLTGLTVEEIKDKHQEQFQKEELKELNRLAEKYNFALVKKE